MYKTPAACNSRISRYATTSFASTDSCHRIVSCSSRRRNGFYRIIPICCPVRFRHPPISCWFLGLPEVEGMHEAEACLQAGSNDR